jgi:hypothetical protein
MEEILGKLDGRRPRQILVGDFNASHPELGSCYTNPRGRVLVDSLHESNWSYIHPRGETQYGTGRRQQSTPNNRPDHALSQGCNITDLHIDELCSTTSDHFPLTFSIDVEESDEMRQEAARSFERLDIRKLADPEVFAQYVSALDRAQVDVLANISSRANLLDQNCTPVERQQLVDDAYDCVQRWVLSAAKSTIGTFKYNSRARWTGLDTPEILAKKEELRDALLVIQNSHGAIQSTARRLANQMRNELTSMLKDQRSNIFRNFADGVEHQGTAALVKIVSCMRSRASRTGCQLHKGRANEYVQYFESTFGGAPTGTAPPNHGVLEASNPTVQSANLLPPATTWSATGTRKILASMANGKAGGTDEILAELLKARVRRAWVSNSENTIENAAINSPSSPTAHNNHESWLDPVPTVLTALFKLVDAAKCPPTLWKKAAVCPVYKNKGSPVEIANYRPISLTSVVRRAFEIGLLHKILSAIEAKLEPEQGGFRCKQGTLMQVLALHEIMAANPDGCYAFLDIKAAFDTVNRTLLWDILAREFQLPTEAITMLRALFDGNAAHLRVQGTASTEFEVRRGVLQGSSLSPVLFSCYINGLISRLKAGPRDLATSGRKWNCLFFADDAVVFAKTAAHLQQLLEIAMSWAEEHGIQFAPSKCEVLSRNNNCNVTMGGVELARVNSYKYLGCEMTVNGLSSKRGLDKRMPKAKSAMGFLVSKGMNGYGWAPQLSLQLYKSFIRPMVEYGLLLAPLDAADAHRLQLFERNCLRKILSVAKNTSTGAIQGILGIEGITHRIARMRAAFFSRLHNDQRVRIPAVAIYRDVLKAKGAQRAPRRAKSDDEPPAFSLVTTAQLAQPLPKLQRVNLIFNVQLSEQRKREMFNKNQLELAKFAQEQFIQDLAKGTNVGLVHAPFQRLGANDTLIAPAYGLEHKERRTLIMWLVGRVCYHQLCSSCDHIELTRAHGLACSGASELILQESGPLLAALGDLVETDTPPPPAINGKELNQLDLLLWHLRRLIVATPLANRDQEFCEKVKSVLLLAVRAIRLICTHCRANAASHADDWGRSAPAPALPAAAVGAEPVPALVPADAPAEQVGNEYEIVNQSHGNFSLPLAVLVPGPTQPSLLVSGPTQPSFLVPGPTQPSSYPGPMAAARPHPNIVAAAAVTVATGDANVVAVRADATVDVIAEGMQGGDPNILTLVESSHPHPNLMDEDAGGGRIATPSPPNNTVDNAVDSILTDTSDQPFTTVTPTIIGSSNVPVGPIERNPQHEHGYGQASTTPARVQRFTSFIASGWAQPRKRAASPLSEASQPVKHRARPIGRPRNRDRAQNPPDPG